MSVLAAVETFLHPQQLVYPNPLGDPMKTLSSLTTGTIIALCTIAGAQVKIDLPFDISCKADKSKYDVFELTGGIRLNPPFSVGIPSTSGCTVNICLNDAPDSALVTRDGKTRMNYKPRCQAVYSQSETNAAKILFNGSIEKVPEATIGFKVN